ncbi:MAG TPA: class I SAM-dependent methyltransferase [Burkholderiales bacterium]|nr:class I SAM-dependent methyltransferase [Burkholderiales bacterium]
MSRRSLIARLALLAAAAVFAGSIAAQSPHTHQHHFKDAQKWSQVFDDPKRDAWQKPHEVIQALAPAPDAVVVDIGAGTGYFAARLAHMLSKGRVYAVDTEPAMVKHLTERAKREGLTNLIAIAGRSDEVKLPQKVDLALLVDVYHHIDKREAYFRNLADTLKPNARLAIIDFRMDSNIGPPVASRIAPERVKAELSRAGYEISAEHAFLSNQYFLVFRRTAN